MHGTTLGDSSTLPTHAARRELPVVGALGHSLLYLAGAVVLGDGVAALDDRLARHIPWWDRTTPTGRMLEQGEKLLAAGLWTWCCSRRAGRPVGLEWEPGAGRQVIAGVLLGAAGGMVVVGVSAARGWVTTPAWGWERVPLSTLAVSLAELTVTHAAVAVSEELVFRGYGLARLAEAVGADAAGLIPTGLFALYHERRSEVLAATGAMGVLLLALRAQQQRLWLPIGVHWGWNLVETALFGPVTGPPSLRPLHVTRPTRWLGRYADGAPGLLAAGVSGLLAAGLLGWQGWRRRIG